MGSFFKMLGMGSSGGGSASTTSWEPLSLGEGDAGFGMSLVVDTIKHNTPKRVPIKYAPANLYASLIEKGCRTAAEGGAKEPWVVYVGMDGTLVGFHFASATWHKVKFSVAGQQWVRKAWGGGGGRILLELVAEMGSVVKSTPKLWNPVTGSLWTLPSFQSIRHPCAFGLSKDKVVAAGMDDGSRYSWVEMLSSGAAQSCWRILGSLPRPYALRLDPLVECNGNFYALLMFPDHHMLEVRQHGPNYLNVCDTPNVWRPTLVSSGSQLFFAGVNYDDDIVRIWRLCDGEKSCWQEVACPVSPAANIERHLISVISVGSALVFCLRNHDMLSFDLTRKTWTTLPVCPEPSYSAIKWTPSSNDSTF